MNWTGVDHRVLQVHPSRRCNLQCLHCYSSSGPREQDDLDPALLRAAIADAANAGYNVVSFSGGEPTLYAALPDLLKHAKRLGVLTAVTTNGMLLDSRRMAALAPVLDFLAISVDGQPESHNRLRNSPRAFETMQQHLAQVRESNVGFGFIFTLTHSNVDELAWVAEFAHREGARSLQIHPLEAAGRAYAKLRGDPPDDRDMALAWLQAVALRKRYSPNLAIHADLVHCPTLPSELSEDQLASPLVIEADGTVVPAQYGFPRKYALGNLRQRPLAHLLKEWEPSSFQLLCHRTIRELSRPRELPFVNWYQELISRAHGAELVAIGV
jgi:MoaA/NifB/PqqE/SkfB family radical SAM enzyme